MGENMENLYLLANDLRQNKAVIFTGAGVSTNSGIPDFRSTDGFYEKYHEDDLAIRTFFKDTDRFYIAFQERFSSVFHSKPNDTHKILATMEAEGYIDGIITQNVDRLHQKAGSKQVIEFHGNIFLYDLIKVSHKSPQTYRILEENVPYTSLLNEDQIVYRVDDNTFYKPQVVLYGEGITKWPESASLAQKNTVHIIIGTSFLVSPFNLISYENKNAKVYVINKEPIQYEGPCTQIIGDSSDILKQLQKILKGDA